MAEHNDAQLHYRFGTYGPRPEVESRLNPHVAPFSPSLYYSQASYQADAQVRQILARGRVLLHSSYMRMRHESL